VPAAFTQAELRAAFARWGLPRAVRVDNGAPWGSAADLPTGLALWLIGLGVEVIHNPPRRPQDNGVVERSQGTGKRWAEPHTCRDADELRRRLEEQDAIQREEYPSIKGRTRMEAFPGLRHSGRPYRPEAEAAAWDLAPVLRHLAGYVLTRRADGGGTVSLLNRNRYVSRALAGREVFVTLDPLTTEWVYSGPGGVEYRRQKAEELTAERVVALDVGHHRERHDPPRRKGVAGFAAGPPVG
jgi:transposase InsO family protein